MCINAPEGCQRGTHTNETAYPLGTYASVHTQTHSLMLCLCFGLCVCRTMHHRVLRVARLRFGLYAFLKSHAHRKHEQQTLRRQDLSYTP